MNKPTQEYSILQDVFDYYNRELFDENLSPALITFQRRRNARGYFWARSFAARKNPTLRTDEIALNPDTFIGRSDKEVMSTLVHEMAHLWQDNNGKPGKRGYHNRQWARKMLQLGLQPMAFDKHGNITGKMTGYRVSHAIIPGGHFDEAADRLLSTGFHLNWQSAVVVPPNTSGALTLQTGEQNRNKAKYTCPNCDQNAWAKPNARLICGFCNEKMERKG